MTHRAVFRVGLITQWGLNSEITHICILTSEPVTRLKRYSEVTWKLLMLGRVWVKQSRVSITYNSELELKCNVLVWYHLEWGAIAKTLNSPVSTISSIICRRKVHETTANHLWTGEPRKNLQCCLRHNEGKSEVVTRKESQDDRKAEVKY